MTAPIAWIVRHPADTPQTRPAVYFSATDAERHAAEYAGAVVVPLGDVAAARANERRQVAWATPYAKVLLELKDSLAEHGARPVTPSKAALWDKAWSVYVDMLKWANPSP